MIYEKLQMLMLKYKKERSYKSLYLSAGIILISLFAFFELAENCLSGKWIYDAAAINYVYSIRDETRNNIFKAITSTGNTIPVITITLIIVVYLFYIKKKSEGLFFGLNVLGLWIFNEILKFFFKRPRPTGTWLVNASGYSFPSGHAMIFMGLSLLSIYYILIYIKNRRIAILVSLLIFMYSVLVGLSRIYVGVHYLSDVLTGWIAGLMWVVLTVSLKKHLSYKEMFDDEQYNEEILADQRKTK